tara:strand:+ start:1623 stop:1805 length:183 start_codon:yes stop_codon:yes gene_type:complete
MSLLFAQQAIVDIQERIESMTNKEIVQALEVIRVTIINEGTKDVGPCRWFYGKADEEEKN